MPEEKQCLVRSANDGHGLAPVTGSMTRATKPYVCHYYHDGGNWGIEIHAYDDEDAEARVKKLGNLKLDGRLMMTIPAHPGAGFVVKSMCWLRNKLRSSNEKLSHAAESERGNGNQTL